MSRGRVDRPSEVCHKFIEGQAGLHAIPYVRGSIIARRRPNDVAEQLLTQLSDAEPVTGLFDRQNDDWGSFTSFVLATTARPASVGFCQAWGIGVALSHTIAVSLSNGALLAAGTTDARDELTETLNEWRKLGKPDLASLTPSFPRDTEGWAVRPQPNRNS